MFALEIILPVLHIDGNITIALTRTSMAAAWAVCPPARQIVARNKIDSCLTLTTLPFDSRLVGWRAGPLEYALDPGHGDSKTCVCRLCLR